VISATGENGPPQVGVVAGRRLGSAVVRNRAKRRIREALARAELREATSYIIVALPRIVDADFADIAGWVRRGVRSSRRETTET
jgi:ribonuclease P protein component